MPTPENPIPTEDVAFYIRTFWKAIISANWNKDDLIELGKLAYAKVPIAEVDEETFRKLLPHLKAVATTFGKLMSERVESIVRELATPPRVATLESKTPESKTPESTNQAADPEVSGE